MPSTKVYSGTCPRCSTRIPAKPDCLRTGIECPSCGIYAAVAVHCCGCDSDLDPTFALADKSVLCPTCDAPLLKASTRPTALAPAPLPQRLEIHDLADAMGDAMAQACLAQLPPLPPSRPRVLSPYILAIGAVFLGWFFWEYPTLTHATRSNPDPYPWGCAFAIVLWTVSAAYIARRIQRRRATARE